MNGTGLLLANPLKDFEDVRYYSTFGQTHGPKIRCLICGRTGYPNGRWMESCLRGHRPCDWCGRLLIVKLDGGVRVHTRCPEQAP